MNNSSFPDDDPTSIGNILVEMGAIEREELSYLVISFKETEDQLLGEYLISEVKGITKAKISLALMKQRALRNKRISHAAIISSFDTATKTTEEIGSRSEEIASLSRALVAKA